MPTIRQKQAHLWERDPHDWYVEPFECSRALFKLETFSGTVWDPACGMGRIVHEARAAGLDAVGTDIVARGPLCASLSDFLAPTFIPEFSNIVTNPPFSLAEDFVRKALEIVPDGGKVAVIVPLVWLSGFSSKRNWMPKSPLHTVFPISPRPSMPPGAVIEAGIRPGNGTKDFSWLVWQKGYLGQAQVRFMNTNDVSNRSRGNSRTTEGDVVEGTFQWAAAE